MSRRDEARDPRDLTTHAVSQRPDGPNYRWPGVAGGDPGLEKRPEGWKREDHRALARSGQVSNGTGLLIPDNSTPDFLGSPIFLKHRSTSACRSRRPCKEEALRGPGEHPPAPPSRLGSCKLRRAAPPPAPCSARRNSGNARGAGRAAACVPTPALALQVPWATPARRRGGERVFELGGVCQLPRNRGCCRGNGAWVVDLNSLGWKAGTQALPRSP